MSSTIPWKPSPRRWSRPARAYSPPTRSTGTIEKRFNSIKVENTEENRRAYRDMLFRRRASATVHQRRDSLRRDAAPEIRGRHAVRRSCWRRTGILPGIKVDTGAKDLALCPGETVTEGLDNLRQALRRVREARREVRQVARGHHHRQGHPERDLHRGQRPRARALRRDLPGRGAGADRRAGSADGRRPHHRALRGGDGMDARTPSTTRST